MNFKSWERRKCQDIQLSFTKTCWAVPLRHTCQYHEYYEQWFLPHEACLVIEKVNLSISTQLQGSVISAMAKLSVNFRSRTEWQRWSLLGKAVEVREAFIKTQPLKNEKPGDKEEEVKPRRRTSRCNGMTRGNKGWTLYLLLWQEEGTSPGLY